jgi:hypothetical protein
MAMPPWAAVEVLAVEEEARLCPVAWLLATRPRARFSHPRVASEASTVAATTTARWRRRRNGEGEGVVDAWEGPLLLLGADDDGHHELLLLGELGRDVKVLAKLGCAEVVVRGVADHVIGVIVDHPTVVDQARDLAGDPWRWWRRLLGLDANAFLIALLVVLLLVIVRGGL